MTILSSLRLDTSRLQSYLLRVLPAKHFDRGYEKLLMELLAIRLSEQKTLAKSLVMSGHPHGPLLHKPVQDEQLTEICRAHSGGDAA